MTERSTVDLAISGMTCATCAARIEKRLNRIDGVRASVNYATESAHVTIDGAMKERTFESAMLVRRAPGNAMLPIEFYISVKAQQETKFSAMSQNELALRMLQGGMMTPAQAVELMVFEGKDQLLKQLKEQSEKAEALAKQQQQQTLPQTAGGAGRNA